MVLLAVRPWNFQHNNKQAQFLDKTLLEQAHATEKEREKYQSSLINNLFPYNTKEISSVK